MSYVAFALKYRPQNFDEVVGQKHVVVSLKNAILQNHVHHAYLFSGPRGVGKTSLARILAKSLNCFDGPTVSPCGKCGSCTEIIRGASLDIIEIDGASNRGIDEMRVLRENVNLSPAYSRYKIYIIDEVHMLTPEAFNALLKTLEEPPAHVKFIFATTHPQKVLPTILSRCQRFQFSLITLEEIVAKLKKIVEAEKVEVENNLFYEIGRAASGSIRDAESLLDQIVPIVLNKGDIVDVLSFLGVIDENTLNTVLKHIVEKDFISSMDFIDKLVKEGKDLGVFLAALLEYLRNFLLAKVSIKSFNSLLDISPQSKEFMLKQSESISASQIIKVIDSFIEAKELSAKLNTVRLPLELSIIKVSYSYHGNNEAIKPLPVVQSKEENITSNFSQSIDKNQFDLDIDSLDEDDSAFTANNGIDDSGGYDDNSAVVDDGILCRGVKSKWGQIIAAIQKVRAALASHLSFSQPVSSQGSLIKIAFSKKDYFHKEILEEAKKTKVIEDVIENIIGQPIRIKFVFQDKIEDFLPQDEDQKLEPNKEKTKENIIPGQNSDDEFINGLLDVFNGKIATESE